MKILCAATLLLAMSCTSPGHQATLATDVGEAPRADQRPTQLEAHGHVRTDEYYWLREREDPEVVAYLEAENEYTSAVLAPTEALQAELARELAGRVVQDDSTVPYPLDGWLYYTRYEDGLSYPIHCRKRGESGSEEILLDLNALSEGHTYYSISSRTPSPSHRYLAYAVDTRGRRIYSIEVRDLETGAVTETIPDTAGGLVWAADDETLFYARRDLETLRTYQIWRHTRGTDPASDVLVHQEDDEIFSCFVRKSRSRQFVMIGSRHTLSTEYRVIPASAPETEPRVLVPRRRDLLYYPDHHGEHFYIRTNLGGTSNFRLMRAPVDSPDESSWTEVIPHREDVLLEGVDLFQDHYVTRERRLGLVELQLRKYDSDKVHSIDFGEPAYSVRATDNHEFDTHTLRYSYSSLTTPRSIYDLDTHTLQAQLLKRQAVLGGFEPTNYRTERHFVTARDGASVPVSLVYRHPLEKNGERPLLEHGYGSYGSSRDASFNPSIISLLDRGFVYAIAHVRGGQELGRAWYEDGKLLHKRNTFNDFIDVGRHLVDAGYTSPDRLFCQGGSAGGLLVGAVMNMAPTLYKGVVAAVPFVDVVTTMLDASIPLTTFEWDEWGDPRQKEYYDYMLSYSPYDQVEAQDYPNVLVTTGLHDSQVQYWEPAKWVARLRVKKTDDNALLLKTNMHAGHGGASGRDKRYREQALVYAFLLSLAPSGE